MVDLYSGSGSFTLGAGMAGISDHRALDCDPDKCATYAKNFGGGNLIQAPVCHMWEWHKLAGWLVVLAAGAACQPFSGASGKPRRGADERARTLFWIPVVADFLEATVVILENVPKLVEEGSEFAVLVNIFTRLGYAWWARHVEVAHGLGQARKRVLVKFVRNTEACMGAPFHILNSALQHQEARASLGSRGIVEESSNDDDMLVWGPARRCSTTGSTCPSLATRGSSVTRMSLPRSSSPMAQPT